MKKINILFTINNLSTAGMRYVLADIAENLNQNEFKVSIAVNRFSDSPLENRLKEKFSVIKLPLRTQKNNPILFVFQILNQIFTFKGKAAIVHSFDYGSDWAEAFSWRLWRIPFISEKTNLVYHHGWDKKLSISTHIITLSKAQKKLLNKYTDKVSVIPTGIDAQRFLNAKAESREQWDIPKEKDVFISIAHLVDVKGYSELIEAIALLKSEFPNLLFIAVGEGESIYEHFLKNKAKTYGVEDMIWFIGGSSKVPELLKMADVKILATQNRGRREGFGAAIVEAMACNLPVLSTKSGGPEDIVIDGETGWLMGGDGVEDLVAGIRRAMTEKSKWQGYGQNGFTRFEAEYTKDLMVKRYSAIYKKVI